MGRTQRVQGSSVPQYPDALFKRRSAFLCAQVRLPWSVIQPAIIILTPFLKVDPGVSTRICPGFIQLQHNVFLNFGCVILDVCEVVIGDGTQIGPHVQILAADHPRDAADRATGLENGKPVRIGKDCWIGGGAIILPGVHIGDGAIVGAGAVVLSDVAAGATVVGNPARTVR